MKLELIDNPTEGDIRLLMKWRRKVHKLWRDSFYATFDSTVKWLSDMKKRGDRIYFVIKNGRKIGQIGFQNIKGLNVDIGFVIRGNGKSDGTMTQAVYYLIGYAKGFGFRNVYVSVLEFNKKALKFWQKIGFHKVKKKGRLWTLAY